MQGMGNFVRHREAATGQPQDKQVSRPRVVA
jgi:hypothetical protein